MGFRKEVREKLEKLEEKVDWLVEVLGEESRLVKQNEALFDKLMARNWEEYQASPSMQNREETMVKHQMPLLPKQDESSIGEILSDEEINK